MSELTIRPIEAGDRAAWEPLWAGYLEFYESRLPADVTESTWRKLTSGDGIFGFLALDASGAIGLVHYLYHPSTWSVGGYCYLQDLFVVPSSRGRSVGRTLIEAVVSTATAKGVSKVYWQTEEFNGKARRMYERVAKRSPFILYEIPLR